MIIPTFLIIPPAIAALVIYLWLYYERNPARRVTDLRMLLAIACFGLIVAYLVVMIQRYDRAVPSMVCFALAIALLMWSIRMRKRQPFSNPGGKL